MRQIETKSETDETVKTKNGGWMQTIHNQHVKVARERRYDDSAVLQGAPSAYALIEEKARRSAHPRRSTSVISTVQHTQRANAL